MNHGRWVIIFGGRGHRGVGYKSGLRNIDYVLEVWTRGCVHREGTRRTGLNLLYCRFPSALTTANGV